MNTSQRLNCFILEGKLFVTCESAAEERTVHGQYTAAQGGPLIFWLLPIVVVVDTQVHCELGHLSSHSGSQQIPALLIEPCMVTTAQQRDKQQNKCLRVISHFITVSRYLSLLSISLSLFMPYFVNTVLFCFRQQ